MNFFGEFPQPGPIQTFGPNSTTAGIGWSVWRKPMDCTMVHFFVQGAGGGGMPGVVGAVSTAAGGGGGGSGAWANFIIPAASLPDELFLSIGQGGRGGVASTAAISTYVSVAPYNGVPPANNLIMLCAGGSSGAAATGATAGTAGAAGVKSSATVCPLIGLACAGHPIAAVGDANMAGHVGGAGGTTGNAAALAYPTNGSIACGGTGGGGLGAAGAVGGLGGIYTAVTGMFCSTTAAMGGTAGSNIRGGDGSSGLRPYGSLRYALGGLGGGAQSSNATPGVAGGGNGGNGVYGSGGGGGGGGFTASTASLGGDGGGGLVIITAW